MYFYIFLFLDIEQTGKLFNLLTIFAKNYMPKIKNNMCFGSVITAESTLSSPKPPILIGLGFDNNLAAQEFFSTQKYEKMKKAFMDFREKTRQFKSANSLPPLDDGFFMNDESSMLKNLLNSQNMSNNYKVI